MMYDVKFWLKVLKNSMTDLEPYVPRKILSLYHNNMLMAIEEVEMLFDTVLHELEDICAKWDINEPNKQQIVIRDRLQRELVKRPDKMEQFVKKYNLLVVKRDDGRLKSGIIRSNSNFSKGNRN